MGVGKWSVVPTATPFLATVSQISMLTNYNNLHVTVALGAGQVNKHPVTLVTLLVVKCSLT